MAGTIEHGGASAAEVALQAKLQCQADLCSQDGPEQVPHVCSQPHTLKKCHEGISRHHYQFALSERTRVVFR